MRSYVLIINVNDLETMVDFYSNMLELGSPVVNSHHWVEFQLENNLILALQQNTSLAQQEISQKVQLVVSTNKYKTIYNKLIANNCGEIKLPLSKISSDNYTFQDPEGNYFILTDYK